MFKVIIKIIENHRGESFFGWRVLVLIKDLLWTAIYWNVRNRSIDLGDNKKYPLFVLYIFGIVSYFKNRKSLKEINTVCFFIGYPRSGHSMIGALLDAHPNMIFSHQLGFIRFSFFGIKSILGLILLNSRNFSLAKRRECGNYQYWIPNQFQGQFKCLNVVGDKGGSELVSEYKKNNSIINWLKKQSGNKLKLLHVVRNPFDSISTISNRKDIRLEEAIEFYFYRVDGVVEIKNQSNGMQLEICDTYHEDFVRNPKGELSRICGFLGVEAGEDYLKDCAAIVYKKPNKSRFGVEWSDILKADVSSRIKKVSYLKHYRFDD